jgi:hypothetical protein
LYEKLVWKKEAGVDFIESFEAYAENFIHTKMYFLVLFKTNPYSTVLSVVEWYRIQIFQPPGIRRIPLCGGGDSETKIIPREYSAFRVMAARIPRPKLYLGNMAHSTLRWRGS